MSVAPVPTARRRRRPVAGALTALAVAIAGAVSAAGPLAGAAQAEDGRFVTLVGDLQDELGCPGDWQPDCGATRLEPTGTPGVHAAELEVPAGAWEYKFAFDGTWDESYGVDGSGDNSPLHLAGPATIRFTFDEATNRGALTPLTLAGDRTAADDALVREPVRQPGGDERFYFVMTDRFANGDPANDRGDWDAADGDAREVHGFDPTDKGFYHGGDLRGLIDRLDYVEGLGTTAIWLTPSFKNVPVQGVGTDDVSAGYHGYWTVDFTQIDPHLGTNAELDELIAEAGARGIDIYFDIITNHTADVITYSPEEYTYVFKADRPYTDAAGNPFDPADHAGAATFPELDPATSFPRVPVVPPGLEDVKQPAWLNDVTLYHNRGNIGDSQWDDPEAATYGDFFGLDDLMTEHPAVVQGFVDVYEYWVDRGVAGFRIDTAKHVNTEFWEQWASAIKDHAPEDFFMFGEVYSGDPNLLAPYVRDTDMSSVLDFAFQAAASGFATGANGDVLQRLFANDSLYTTPDSSAYALPTFLGNHDMGRIGFFVRNAAEREEASALAHSLMYLTRGQPVVYYGDEQGFVGAGGDKDARQDMFATQVAEYADQPLLDGTTAGSVDRYDTGAALYEHIARLAQLREDHPALAQGAQVERVVGSEVYGFSRVDRDERVEHVVVANNGEAPADVELTTLTPGATYTPLLGGGSDVTAADDGALTVTVPARDVVVLRADRQVAAADGLAVDVAPDGGALTGLAPVTADVTDGRYVETSFAYREVGTEEWTHLGTSDRGEPRVHHDVRDLPRGTLVEYRAVATDLQGNVAAGSGFGAVGIAVDGVVPDEEPPPSEQPPLEADSVNVPGTHQTEMGCGADWDPACEQTQMTQRADGVWELRFEGDLPAGDYEFKIALDGSWARNIGSNWQQDGPNLAYTHAGGPIQVYFDPVTRYFFTTSIHPVMTLPGDFQSELGCPGDWAPDCLRTMLVDLDGDGVLTFTTSRIPAGSWQVKVAHGMSWGENYGKDGVRDGENVLFVTDGSPIEFRYDPTTHVLTVAGPTDVVGGVGQLAAKWVSREHLVLPPDLLGGADPADAEVVLHTAPTGGMALDAENAVVLPDDAGAITLTPTGQPSDAVTERFPHLADHVVLALDGVDEATLREVLTGQLVVSVTVDGELVAFTGVQIPGVVDDLYAESAAERDLGLTWHRSTPTVALWAPTAKGVTLLVWQKNHLARDPQRVTMTRQDDGSWTATGKASWEDGAYLFEVEVYVPSTGQVETNVVTDPYSVGLTPNSTRSVFVDLGDPRHRPRVWEKAAQPVVRPVDQTIYELHVRDFSWHDESVPERLRGTYLAFAEEDTAGRNHLRALAEAGLTTVHLLPTFDIATIEEDRSAQELPPCDLASFAPDSPEQQACIEQVADADGFNWGYDPFHWTTPEGSYAVDAYGGDRVFEFRTMVGALHGDGLQVVLDQVFNHTAQSGQGDRSVLDKVVPGYYHRLDTVGQVETSTCCQNVATEHRMAEKMMVDSVVVWARDYKVDGFRFDLMGHHSRANMEAVRAALDELTPSRDGVDGSKVYLYGEGWNFGEVADNARFHQATQGQLDGTGIGTFSDRLRDAVRGGGPFDEDPRVRQGFGSGAWTDPNGLDARPEDERLADARHQTDLVRLGLAGNLRDFAFTTSSGEVRTGAELDYNGQPAGYASSPEEIITYVDKHDNETLFDILALKLPADTPMDERVRMNTVALSTAALSQTPAFFHAGSDLLRSKSLDRNSYDSGDWFNVLDFTGRENGFARGLPRAADNESKWPFLAPLLADPALVPTPEHVADAAAAYQDLLELRFSTDLFRLGDAELIKERVTFPNSGADTEPGVIVMSIDDRTGQDVDPDVEGVLVVFNASDEEYSAVVDGEQGREYALSEVQATGSDDVVRATTWDAATGTVTVPARTVAVLVDAQAAPEPPPSCTPPRGIVGLIWQLLRWLLPWLPWCP